MSKIALSLMAALFAVPAFFSCSEREVETPVEETDYKYRFEIAEGETRATLGDMGVFWEENDQVGVFVGSGSSLAADVNLETTPKTVDLTTALPLAAGTVIHAYYPYQAGDARASAAKIVFPRYQQGGSRSAMPLAGLPVEVRDGNSTNGSIFFLNLGSIIDFRVFSPQRAGEQIQSVTFAVESGFVAGDATLDLTSVSRADAGYQIPELTWTDGQSSVTLTQDATVAFDKETAAASHLYMVVAPGTYSGTITVVTNAATYTFPFTNLAFNRNGLRGVNLNLESGNATRVSMYTRISTLSQVVDKDTYLIVHEGVSPARAFHPVLNSDGSTYALTGNAEQATVTSGQIPVVSGTALEASRVILEKVPGTNSDFYIKVPAADYKYLYLSGSSIKVGQNPSTFTFDNKGKVKIKRSTANYYLRYSDNAFSTGSSSFSLALFKQDDGGLAPQTLAFSATNFTLNVYGQALPVVNLAGVPTLSGAQTAVTWYSSDPSVATVSSDGSITVLKDGKTVITAVAEANNQFRQGIASYVLNLMNGFSIENDRLAAYLDQVDAHPYNPPSDYTVTYMTADLYNGNTSHTSRLDWPKPVPVSWESNPTTGNADKVVYVYNDSDMNDLELSVSVDMNATSADVYNLIPERVYYYKVMNGDDAAPIADGSFRTTGRRRMIKVGDSPYGKGYANNCRDFGGQVTADGTKRIKYGKMFRGSNMDLVSAADKDDFLKGYLGIGLDVDLRRDQRVQSWDGYAGDGNNIIYDALGLGDDWHTNLVFSSWDDLSSPAKIKGILTKVFSAVEQGKGVYIHCMVGADRTGYVCLLIEAILGIPQGACDVDYELTSFSGAVDSGKPRLRTGVNNHYYRAKDDLLQGVDYIYSLDGGSYGNSFQAKAVNYVVEELDIEESLVTAFQDNMLEENK